MFAAGVKRTLRGSRLQGRQVSLALAAAVGVTAVTVVSARVVYNDAAEAKKRPAQPIVVVEPPQDHTDNMTAWSWGSNDYKVASSSASTSSAIKTPQPLPHLSGVALRDLVLHEKHGACVDAAGNVYQWGDGFFDGTSTEARKPKLTLKGKDIQSLSVTAHKVYALSKSGKVYVLSADESKQGQMVEPSSWWTLPFLWPRRTNVNYVELEPDSALTSTEKFTSISSGRDHVLALTSSGRSFAHPANANANAYGQLGLTQVTITSPTDPKKEETVELLPKAAKDPLEKATPWVRPAPEVPLNFGDEKDIKWCTKLHEIPSLKGVTAKQLVAGGRSSYLLTANDGRVLAWGANEFGQLGLGANITLTSVPVPTEVALYKLYPRGTNVKCTHISAGGDIVYYTVERTTAVDKTPVVDVLAAGMGQWGMLGNGLYNQVQGAPVKVKAVSGIMEFNDATQALEAIPPRAISVSPTGHALLTLDAISDTNAGYDVLAWGQNRSYELGNGKQAAIPIPGYVKAFREEPGKRLMVRETKKEVKDLEGKVRGKNVPVQETVVAGWGCTAVYWKIV